MDRLLLFPGIGAFGLLALQADRLGWLEGSGRKNPGFLVRSVTGLLLVTHVLVALLLLPMRISAFPLLLDKIYRAASDLPNDERVPEQTIVLVNGNDLLTAMAMIGRVVEGYRIPRRMALLSSSSAMYEVSRTGPRTLQFRSAQGFLLLPGDRISRNLDPPFSPGQRVSMPDFTAEVLEVTSDGRPAEVVFEFQVPLEDETLRWVYIVNGRMEVFVPPPMGESVQIDSVVLKDFF